MISVYALLCAASLSPGECTPATAVDLIRLPDADNELTCLRDSMTTLAPLAIQPEAGEFWKIICSHGPDRPPHIAAETNPHRAPLADAPQPDVTPQSVVHPADTAGKEDATLYLTCCHRRVVE